MVYFRNKEVMHAVKCMMSEDRRLVRKSIQSTKHKEDFSSSENDSEDDTEEDSDNQHSERDLSSKEK